MIKPYLHHLHYWWISACTSLNLSFPDHLRHHHCHVVHLSLPFVFYIHLFSPQVDRRVEVPPHRILVSYLSYLLRQLLHALVDYLSFLLLLFLLGGISFALFNSFLFIRGCFSSGVGAFELKMQMIERHVVPESVASNYQQVFLINGLVLFLVAVSWVGVPS